MRTFSAVTLTVACTLIAARAHAQTLDEWTLPPGIVELAVDASAGTPVAFVEGANSAIDRFDPSTSTLTRWTINPAAFQFMLPGQIEAHGPMTAPRPAVFVTDAPHNRIGMLDVDGARYRFWDVVIPAATTPRALAVDHATGQVWFTTYDGMNQPAVAVLDPSAATISSWILPLTIADPIDRIDGIAVTRASGSLRVYIAVGERSELLELDPAGGPTALVWPVRYTRPTRIAVNSAGEIFAPNANSNSVLRFSPSTKAETIWFDGALMFLPFISMNSVGHAFLPALDGGNSYIARLIPFGITTILVSTSVATNFMSAVAATKVVHAVPSPISLPMASPPIAPIPLFPFTNWPVPGNGPLSCDPTSPLSDTWFIDLASNQIARLRP